MNILSIVGDRIKRLRERMGITQLEFSNRVGINNCVLSRIEAGKRPVEDDELRLFVNFFETNSDYLLGLTDDPSPNRLRTSGRAFLGGPEQYTEEELEIANAAAKAAIEALRKSRANKKHKY